MKKKRRRCKETKHYRRVVRNRVQEIFGRYDKLCNNKKKKFNQKTALNVVENQTRQTTLVNKYTKEQLVMKPPDQPTPSPSSSIHKLKDMTTSPNNGLNNNNVNLSPILSSNNSSSIQIMNVDGSLSYNQSHFMYESSGIMSDIDGSQSRPLIVSPCKDGVTTLGHARRAPKTTLQLSSFESSSSSLEEAEEDLELFVKENEMIKQQFFDNIKKRISSLMKEGSSHTNVNEFIEKYCQYDSNKFNTSVNILIERLKALALYFSTDPSSQYTAWRTCSALKDIITLSKEEGHNIQPKYYWKHRSLNFCRHYLKIEKSKGFLFSPWLLDNDEVDDTEEDSFDDAEEQAFAESIPFSL